MEFSRIVKEIHAKIDAAKDKSFESSLDITFSHLDEIFEKDGDEKLTSQLIFCGYDKDTGSFRTFVFWFNSRRIPADVGIWQKNSQGEIIEIRYFEKKEVNDRTPVTIKGWVNCLSSLGEFNQNQPQMSLLQGFNLVKRIMELAVTIEEISHEITGIGRKILYAVITKEGFQWVNTEADVMNLICS